MRIRSSERDTTAAGNSSVICEHSSKLRDTRAVP